jgi:hypothetical protein
MLASVVLGCGIMPSMRAKVWATRQLQSGDLTALASIASGRQPSHGGHAEWLAKRRFVRERPGKPVAITLRGRLALLIIKRYAMR